MLVLTTFGFDLCLKLISHETAQFQNLQQQYDYQHHHSYQITISNVDYKTFY